MSELKFSTEEQEAIRKEFAAGSTDTQFEIFISECQRRGLVPGRHVVFQSRRAKEYDPVTRSYQWVSKPVYITTISALRLIAQRTGEYTGQGREKYVYLPNPDEKSDENGFVTSPYPLPDPKDPSKPRLPWLAEATVYRKGFTEPMIGIARFEAYAAYQNSEEGGRRLTSTWATRGPEQLQKCSEALALRRAFVEETSNLYLSEELRSEEDEQPKVVGITPASVVPLPPVAPKVDQTPATPTDAPRPGEVKVEHHVTTVPATLPEHAGSTLVVKEPVAEKPKRGRKPKDNPVNGRDIAAEGGITDEDTAVIGTPAPVEVDQKPAAEEFVASLDPTPTKEEMVGFTTRVRALTAKGRKSDEIKAHVLKVGGVEDTKLVTVGAWKRALDELENPKLAEGEFK